MHLFIGSAGAGVKRSSEESEAVSNKKSRIAKYGLKFQSAGNLVTVGDRVRMEEGGKRGRGYKDSVEEKRERSQPVRPSLPADNSTAGERVATVKTRDDREGSEEDSEQKFSFGFSKNKKPQYRPRGASPLIEKKEGTPDPVPPPLMSRQRELMTKAFGGDSDSEGEGEGAELVKMAVRGTPRFRFQIKK